MLRTQAGEFVATHKRMHKFALTTRCHRSDLDGDEVLFLYHAISDEDIRSRARHPIPIKQLIGFERVTAPKGGGEEVVEFSLTEKDFMIVDEEGEQRLYKGKHAIIVEGSGGFAKQFAFEK